MSSNKSIYEESKDMGIQQTAVDTLAFYLINMAGHKVSGEIPSPSVNKTVIFALADLGVRNKYLTWWKEKFSGDKDATLKNNAYIAMMSFIFATLYDLVKSKDLGKAVTDNLIRNALGLLGNQVVDKMMIDKDYR